MKIVSLFLLLLAFSAGAQCVPDQSFTGTGVAPQVMKASCINAYYSDTLTARVPGDTVYAGFTIPIDSLVVIGVSNLPSGLSYVCGSTNCTAYGNWTSPLFECILVSGIPTVAAFNSPVIVEAEAWVTLFGNVTPIVVTDTVYITIEDQTTASITATSCLEYTSPSGNYTYTSSGTYTDTIPNAAGCDSIITLNLTIKEVDTSLTLEFASITSNQENAVYQWLLCDSSEYQPVIGATNQQLSIPFPGYYAVQVTFNGCTDTSACVYVDAETSVNEYAFGNTVSIYPNPTEGKIQIQLGKINEEVTVNLYKLDGSLIISEVKDSTGLIEMDINGSSGVYIVEIRTEHNVHRSKVLKK